MSNIRIDRLLGNLGYGSRRDIAACARDGRLTLNGQVMKDASQYVTWDDAQRGNLRLDDEPIDPPPPLTIMLHKPAGYSCSHDEKGDLIYDLLPPRWKYRKPALSSAGRLDKDSTGQVILTDDGDVLHRIIHPKHHAQKHYSVTLRDMLRGDEATLFASGAFCMEGDAKVLKPATWSATGEKSGIMILQEGRYHQIRRMFATIGNHVEALHRFQTGGLALGDIQSGQYRILTASERSKIFG